MKRVRVHFLVFSALMVASIVFAGAAAQAADKPIELRFAHQYPVGSPWHRHTEAWAKKIAADSNGRLTVRHREGP
jgi:TRAP-type C4-dicarboxylate transport system substrate-binding protein